MVRKNKILELVKKRLLSFGYTITSDDYFTLDFIIQKIVYEVQNNINRKTIPDELRYEVIDMVCGEFLFGKYASGNLDIETIDLSPIASQIKEGDTSVSFSFGHGSYSPEERFTSIIGHMKDNNKPGFAAYRRIKW